MIPVVTVEQMGEMDRRAVRDLGIPDVVLMENAGRSTFEHLLAFMEEEEVLTIAVLAGKGNNGGDAFVVTRLLLQNGFTPHLFITAPPEKYRGSAAVNLQILLNYGVEPAIVQDTGNLPDLREYDLVLDGLLGTGIKGPVKGIYAALIAAVNESGALVMSVDIPSGVSGDTGETAGSAVMADITVTMCTPKRGLMLPPGREHTGLLATAHIGYRAQDFPEYETWVVPEEEDIREILPERLLSAHKGDLGKVVGVAGSPGMTGAAGLAAEATLAAGCGMTTLVCPAAQLPLVAARLPQVMTRAGAETETGALSLKALEQILELQDWGDVFMAGPGLGRHPETGALVRRLLREAKLPLVLDADGLFALAGNTEVLKEAGVPICLTPHHGEFLRLLNEPPRDTSYNGLVEAGVRFARDFGVTLVLKGAPTAVISHEGDVFINPTGNPGMATAGSGDVLTGIIAGLAAQMGDLTDAAVTGVYLHGLSGDLAAEELTEYSVTAPHLISFLPRAFRLLLQEYEEE